MKKLFSLLTLALLTMSAWAQSTVTIDFSAQGYGNAEDVSTLTVGDVTVDLALGTNSNGNTPKYYTTGKGVRLYVGNTLTLTSAGDNITKAVFTFSGDGYTFGSNTTANTGVYSESSATGTWLGNNASFTVSPARTCRLQKIEVTLGGEVIEPPITVSAPTLPVSQFFDDSFTVNITNIDEGATAKYSTDNQASWNTYNNPFTINATTTVYAKAVKDTVESEIVSATYTKNTPVSGTCITFNYADDTPITTAQEYTVTRNGASFTVSNGMINGHYRIYKDQTITFNSTAGNIIRIEFDGLESNPASNFGVVTGMGYQGNNGIWVGSNETVTFTASVAQVRCSEIRVYVDGELPTDFVANPTFTPASKNFDESIEVTIACATEGATIKYSTDDKATWNDYSTALNITETTTVYAQAFKGNAESDIISATYTKNEPAAGITTLAQANALPDNTEFTFEGTGVVVTYQTDNKQYTFLRDATGYNNFYQADTTNMNNMPALQNGQVLNPNWTATKTTFRNLPEYKNASNVSASTNTDAELAAPIEISALADSMLNAYVTVKNIKKFAVSGKNITITLADGTMVGYNQFNINLTDLPTTEGDYTAIGIVGKYNSNRQLWLISWEGQGTPEPDPVSVNNFAEAYQQESGTKITMYNDVVVTYQNGNRLWIRDTEDASGMIYGALKDENEQALTFANGDVLSDGWTATYELFNGLTPEFTNPKDISDSGDDRDAAPFERTQITTANVNEYVIVKGVTLVPDTADTDIYYTADSLQICNFFNNVTIPSVEENKTYDVTGIVLISQAGRVRIYITEMTEATAAGMRGDVDNSGNVDISDATALINYLLYGNSDGLNMDNANCDLTGGIDISDATTLINYLLYGTW